MPNLRKLFLFVVSVLIGVWIMKIYRVSKVMAQKRPDPSSFSDSSKIRTTSLHIKLSANLDTSVLKGCATLTFERVDKSCNTLDLDSKDLKISKVVDVKSDESLEFTISERYKEFGSSLSIHLKASTTAIKIYYETSPTASGIQVLSPDQTLGGKYPYLFTQNQAIHARSIVPCQDTPGVKSPYSAEIKVVKPLVVIMSAVSVSVEESDNTRTYHFHQKIPIPSYLIAMVIGDVVSKEISDRVKVWSEKENIEDCFYEFADTEKILQTAEDIAGPYVWGRYDLLVLPPSFPYGGMENPCLTFVTPTLLAGDRSLVNVVAHEIAHSWTGNLVTNANWEHFWLNEGFTVFLERKIIGKLAGENGEKVRNFAALNGLSALRYAIEVFGDSNPLTTLNVNLDDVDPDDAFSSVPYEKGFNFLFYLESLVGGPAVFDPFLKEYIQAHSYMSITTDVFVTYFKSKFADAAEMVQWDKWLKSPGLPEHIPKYDDTLQQSCLRVIAAWEKGTVSSNDIADLDTKQVG